MSYITGEIEKWSLFEKQDAWKINAVANGTETFQNIIPIATASDKKGDSDALQAFVFTLDSTGVQHLYSLRSNGEVRRLL